MERKENRLLVPESVNGCRKQMTVSSAILFCLKYGVVGLVWVVAYKVLPIPESAQGYSPVLVFFYGILVFVGGEVIGKVFEKMKTRKKR